MFFEGDSSSDSGGGALTLATLAAQVSHGGEITWLIGGSAGVGKSTALRLLEIRLLRSGIPVLYLNTTVLRDLSPGKHANIRNFVLGNRPASLPQKFWNSAAKHGRVVVLLDGIDEIRRQFDDGPRRLLVQRLLAGNHEYAVVATTRNVGHEPVEWRPVRRVRLKELARHQVRQYLSDHNLDPVQTLNTLEAMGLAETIGNPLLLSAFVTLMQTSTSSEVIAQVSRARLLELAAVGTLDSSRISSRERDQIDDGPSVRAIWAAAGTLAHFAPTRQFTRREVVNLLREFLPRSDHERVLEIFLSLGPFVQVADASPLEVRAYTPSHEKYSELGMAMGWGTETPLPIFHDTHYFGGFIADWCALQDEPAQAVRKLLAVHSRDIHFETLCDLLVADGALLDRGTKNAVWEALGRGFFMSRRHWIGLADALAVLPIGIVREGLDAGLLDGILADAPLAMEDVRNGLLLGTFDGPELRRILRQANRRGTAVSAFTELGVLAAEDAAVPGLDAEAGESYEEAEERAEPGAPESLVDPALDEDDDGGLTDALKTCTTENLIQQLFDDDKPVRKAAAAQLRSRVHEPAVIDLPERLGQLDDPQVARLISGLGRIGSERFLGPLLDRLSTEDASLRGTLVKALSRIGTPSALAAVRRALADSVPSVRITAIMSLVQHGDPTAVPKIVELMNDPERGVSFFALGTVGRYLNYRGSKDKLAPYPDETVQATVASLKQAEEVSVARFCKMLTTMPVPGRLELLEKLTQHSGSKARGAALTTLGMLGAPAAANLARAMLSADDDPVNRAAAITIIARHGDERDFAELRRRLADEDERIRGAAIQALGRLNDRNSRELVAERLFDRHPIVCGSACTTLGLLGAFESIPVITSLLDNEAPNVRGSAARALGLLGSSDSLPQLCGAAQDPVPRVRGTCCGSLGLIGDPAALPTLLAVLRDPVGDVRRAAAAALGFIGDATASSALIVALADDEASVRWSAATALGHIGSEDAVDPIMQLLLTPDPEPRVRGASATALGRIRDHAAIPVLIELLRQPDPHAAVRGAAATALGRIGHPSAVPVLIQTASDLDTVVRGSAASALGKIGDPRSIEVLTRLAGSDPDPIVKASAITALSRLGLPAASETVAAGLANEAAEIRAAAVRATAVLQPGHDLARFLDDPDAAVRRTALAAMSERSYGGQVVAKVRDAAVDRSHTAGTRPVEEPPGSGEIPGDSVYNLQQALDDESPEVAVFAAGLLRRSSREDAAAALIHALRSKHQVVRVAAADSLGVRGATTSSRSALEQVLRHEDAATRMAAVRSLGRLGVVDCLPALIMALKDSDSYVRGAAAMALARVGADDDDARSALITAMEDQNDAVVGLSAQALGTLAGPGVLQALQNCARDPRRNLWTRATAIGALAPLLHHPPPWMIALADEHRSNDPGSSRAKFRGAIIGAISRGGSTEAVADWLVDVLLTDRDPINQTAAATGLGNRGLLNSEITRAFLTQSASYRRSDTGRARPRDGDDAATGAVFQGAIKSAAQNDPHLYVVLDLLISNLNSAPSALVASSALSALRVLETSVALRVMDELMARLDEMVSLRLVSVLTQHREDLNRRQAAESTYRNLRQEPMRFLQAFAEPRRERTEEGDIIDFDIGVITIIGEEARAVQEWLDQHDDEARHFGPEGRLTYQARIPAGPATVRVVATQALEQGATSAAYAHHYLATHFRPRFTILLGVAGGINKDVTLGDVVVAQQVVDYGPAASTADGVRHRGSAFRPPRQVVIALNDFFSRLGEPCALSAHSEAAELGRPIFRLQRGPIGTGPRVVKFRDAEERKFLENFNEKTLALETEAEGVARHFYEQGDDGQLNGYIVLRAISDHADAEKDDQWKLAASRNAVLALQRMLPTIAEALTHSPGP